MDRQFYEEIKRILETARQKAYSAANFAMVEAYWNIGRHIVERQCGDARAEYGSGFIKELSVQMTKDFGKGFTTTNLKYMRQFYPTFPNGHALCDQLSWSHYRLLMRVENANACSFYLNECVKPNKSTRQLCHNNSVGNAVITLNRLICILIIEFFLIKELYLKRYCNTRTYSLMNANYVFI